MTVPPALNDLMVAYGPGTNVTENWLDLLATNGPTLAELYDFLIIETGLDQGTAFNDLLYAFLSGAGDFDPLSFGSPVVAVWADDPDWTPPADGQPVGTWPNQGSAGGDFTGAGGARPLYDADGGGGAGKASVVFDGTDDTLSLTGLTPESSPLSAVVVIAPTTDADPRYALAAVMGDFSSGILHGVDLAGTNAEVTDITSTIALTGVGAVTPGSFAVLEARWPDTGDVELWVDGVEVDSDTTASQSFEDVYLGSGAGLAGFFAGSVAFAAIYPAATAPEGLVAGLLTYYSI